MPLSGRLLSVKAVIINADDFGSHVKANKAILHAHTEGILTSASLMVNGDAVEEAVQIAEEHPTLAVGLHLTVVNGRASLPSSMVPRIVNEFGMFEEDPFKAGLRYYFSSRARWEVQQEVEAQFRQFASLGIDWSHVDGHHHMHMHPVVWDAIIANCEEYGIQRIRIPNEEWRPVTQERLRNRKLEWTFFQFLRKRCLKSLKNKGFVYADNVYGHVESGHMNEAYVLGLLDRLAGKTNEIYFHPGTPHADKMPGMKGMDVELHALLSREIKEKLEDLEIKRCSYIDLE